MMKNDNIFIILQIQKDQESKVLFLNIQLDKAAPNFSIQDETITWCPTFDEIDFITEAFELIRGYKGQGKTPDNVEHSEFITETTNTVKSDRHSSETRIAPPSDDSVIEVAADVGSSHTKKKTTENNIFVQADDKTIDEVLKRKKPGAGEDHVIESGEKTLIDRMLKQKKKKE